MKPLLIFDFSGVLANKNDKSFKKGIVEFLQKCNKDFDISVWTSGKYRNYNHLVQGLERDLNFNFLFCWYRDRTQFDPNYGIDPDINDFDTIKNLSQVINSPTLNYDRYYNKDNIIIVDDSLKKVCMNKHYVIADNDSFDSLYDKIMKKYSEMN